MLDTILNTVNFSLSIASLILMCFGGMLSRAYWNTDKTTKRFFVRIFSVMILYVVSNLLEQICYMFLNFPVMYQLTLFMESFFSSVLLLIITGYLLHCSNDDYKKSPLAVSVWILWIVYMILLVITQFTDFIYYFSPDGVYHRGPYYPLLLLPPAAIMLLNLVGLFRRRKRLAYKQFVSFLVYFITPMAAMVLQMFFYGLYLIVFATAFSAAFMYVYILSDQLEQYIRQNEENTRLRTETAVLKMRPHFIYNTMTSIYYLIRQDSEKAQKVTLDFTNYLRRNFTAIAKTHMIPFEEELEHTRAYLAVEQVRFEGKLVVDFDTPYMDFFLPPLTLQPIVENAVKHGIDPDLGPLHIRVSTRATDKGTEIIVENDGPPFAAEDNDDPHIALVNIRERLDIMCGGSLTISSGSERGTVVKILIPE